MAKLTYSAIGSIDGYTVDADGSFAWAMPEPEVHALVNDLTRPIGTLLLGRRMYEVSRTWETLDVTGEPPVMQDFKALWLAADKIVYSRTLEAPTTARTTVEREFDTEAVARLKEAAPHELGIAGPELAGLAMRAGLVDELQLFAVPHVVGGGTRALPDGWRATLELVEERRFPGGTVFTRYAVR